MKLPVMAVLCCLCSNLAGQADADWKPAAGPLMTRWAKDVSPQDVHSEYPRPQMVRGNWQNLNGLWEYAITPKDGSQPKEFDGQILVPFPIESALSGVKKTVGGNNMLWYRRDFTAKKKTAGDGHVLLHFGAVDWRTTVWVNGQKVGTHQGGYDPFSFDITDAVTDSGKQELIVSVWDPTNGGYQPRGKQVTRPGSIWYTSVTGIWQTVWLENVQRAHIDSLKIVPDVDRGIVRITTHVSHARDGDGVIIHVLSKAEQAAKSIATATCKPGETVEIKINDARLWSPDDPHLYGLTVTLTGDDRDSAPVDQVQSYFGMRKIALGKDKNGHTRMFLNNRPLFHFGPLDQGWWPDGLYTAPTDAALRYDIEMTKKLGFNMARKHVKVEPARWYYHCDRLGLMVWQDMPNGDGHIRGKAPDLKRSPESAANFRHELKALIDTHHNHPCIVTWVPFNEGWGQFDTHKILGWVKQYDPTRLVDGPSGWTDRGSGDIHDVHHYPGPGMPKLEEKRTVVLGEFGGLGLPLEGHLWWNKRNWGYRTYKTKMELRKNYDMLIKKLRPLYAAGLAGAIYTQTTDVEGEVNGLMTYDRAVVKFDVSHMHQLHRRFYRPPPRVEATTLLPTSEKKPQTWRYTLKEPAEGWHKPDFDDDGWTEGPGGFGTKATPGTVVRSTWDTKAIWVRRTFRLDRVGYQDLHLRIHHDEDALVFLNGRQIAKLSGYTSGYTDIELDKAAAAALQKGKNTIAIHCRQTAGGQYIDAGLVDIREIPDIEPR